MQNGAIVICSSQTLVNTSSAAIRGWNGGQAALVIEADAFPTNLHLEVRGWGGGWVRAHTSNIAANQAIALNAPAGVYRMTVNGSSVINLFAVLCPTP